MTGTTGARHGLRTILHIDMDAYFAEVERLCNPRLVGKPLIIGGRPGERGAVATASYEARSFGIKSGMSLTRAEQLCPGAIFLPSDLTKYANFSSRIMKFLLQITPNAEMWSIDEAFLDLSDLIEPRADRFMMPLPSKISLCSGRPVRELPLFRLASSIRDGIAKEFKLTCSIGGGPNKLVAKMATGIDKPRGLTLLSRNAFRRLFRPRPVEDLMGIGEKTGVFLRRLGYQTIGDLAAADPRSLSSRMGIVAESIVAGARGEEGSPVVPFGQSPPPKSLGHEHTVSCDLACEEEVSALLLALTDRVAYDLRAGGYVGRTVVLKMRTSSFRTLTRQRTLREPTNENRVLFLVARELYQMHRPDEPIRLLGVTLGQLITQNRGGCGVAAGEPLLPEDRKYRRLLKTLDHLHKEYGSSSVFRAATLKGHRDKV